MEFSELATTGALSGRRVIQHASVFMFASLYRPDTKLAIFDHIPSNHGIILPVKVHFLMSIYAVEYLPTVVICPLL